MRFYQVFIFYAFVSFQSFQFIIDFMTHKLVILIRDFNNYNPAITLNSFSSGSLKIAFFALFNFLLHS